MNNILNIDLRIKILDLIVKGQGGHIPSAYSIVDLINALYADFLRYDPRNPLWEERDYFILSKGHGCAALYAVLHKFGFFDQSVLDGYLKFDGLLGGHPDRTKIPGIEASTGSLGHGFNFAVGIALGCKIKRMNNKIIVLVGDGECHEGTIWEAALVAQNLQLKNLLCIVDYNESSSQILPHPNIEMQWSSFGWNTCRIDGHSMNQISSSINKFYNGVSNKPTVIIANTVKGKGVSLLEKHGPWHYKVPDSEEYKLIKSELMHSANDMEYQS